MRPATVLVVEDDEIFAELLQHFPVSRYTLLFATNPAEAMTLVESRAPRLIVIPTGGYHDELPSGFRAVDHTSAVAILGLDPELEPGRPAGERNGFDRVVSRADTWLIVSAARRLLNERRERPRVIVQFPVRLGESGTGVARDLSAVSLVVETREPLKKNDRLAVELDWGEKPTAFVTTVQSVRSMEMGFRSAVLRIDEEDTTTRDYLDQVVRQILEVEHYLYASEPGRAAVRGQVSWDLARRAEQSLRRTSELGIAAAVDELFPAESVHAPDALESRYELGDAVAEWGVGEVREALHRLLETRVWVKRLRQELLDNDHARQRLEREARLASTLAAECVADVLDFGDDGQGGLFYSMERLTGITLAEAREAGEAFGELDAARLGAHLALSLSQAHELEILHLDICPKNIFLHQGADGWITPKLLNFAGSLQGEPAPAPYSLCGSFRPPGQSVERAGPLWDVHALARTLGLILPPPQDPSRPPPLRLVLSRALDGPAPYDSMAALCKALCGALLKLDQDASGESRIAPVRIPETLEVERLPSYATLKAIPDPPVQIPWPRATLKGKKEQAPGFEGEPTRVEPKPAKASEAPGPAAAGRTPFQSGRAKPSGARTLMQTPGAPPAVPRGGPARPVSGPQSQITKPGRKVTAPRKRITGPQPAVAPPQRAASGEIRAATSSGPRPIPTPPPAARTLTGQPAIPKRPARAPATKTEILWAVKPELPQKKAAPPPIPRQAASSIEIEIPIEPEEQPVETGPPTSAAPAPKPPAAVALAPMLGAKEGVALPGKPPLEVQAPPKPTTEPDPVPRPRPRPATTDTVKSAIADELALADLRSSVATRDMDEIDAEVSAARPLEAYEAPDTTEVRKGTVDQMPALQRSPEALLTAPEPRRLWLIPVIAGAVLLLLGGAFSLYWFVIRPGMSEDEPETRGTRTAKRPAAGRTDSPGSMRPPLMSAMGTVTAHPPDAGVQKASSVDAGTTGTREPDAGPADAGEVVVSGDEPRTMGEPPNSRQRRREEAKKRLEKRLDLINKARRQMRKGHYEASRRHLTEALKMWDSPRLRQLFAMSYERVGKIWPAIYHLKKAIGQAPSRASLHRKLGQLYLRVGKRRQACTTFDVAVKLAPGSTSLAKLRRKHCGR